MVSQIVIDTNVLTSALRSRQGVSYRLFSLLGSGRFAVSLSVPVLLEYEQVSAS
jgi:predicted nucleic acid-binding protein